MRAVIGLLYVLMAGCLVIASMARVAAQLTTGDEFDPLPIAAGGVGIVALALAYVGRHEWRER